MAISPSGQGAVSKLEEVMNEIAWLQQQLSQGAITDAEYEERKEAFIALALPGNRGPGPAISGTRLSGNSPPDTGRTGFSPLKWSLPVLALLAAFAALIVAVRYYPGTIPAHPTREVRRVIPPPAPKTAPPADDPAPLPAPLPPPAPKAAEPAPAREALAVAPQIPIVRRAEDFPPLGHSLPTTIGRCAETVVSNVARRPYDQADGESSSGSAIAYRNGGRQVSSTQIGGIDASMPGDKIQLCLVAIPAGCPKGDMRGAIYHAINLRTGLDWDAPNAEQSCGA